MLQNLLVVLSTTDVHHVTLILCKLPGYKCEESPPEMKIILYVDLAILYKRKGGAHQDVNVVSNGLGNSGFKH